MDEEAKRLRFEETRDAAQYWWDAAKPCPHCGEAIPIEDDACPECVTERRSGRMERLEQEVEKLTRQLADLREYYRPRWMPDEPAPRHSVSVWDPYNSYWYSAYGGRLTGDLWWTNQPPAIEAEGPK